VELAMSRLDRNDRTHRHSAAQNLLDELLTHWMSLHAVAVTTKYNRQHSSDIPNKPTVFPWVNPP